MFQNLQVIAPATDAQTRYTPGIDWKVSVDQSSVPVTRDEMPTLAEHFVLAFSVDTPSYPLALLGCDGKNTYLNSEGNWDAAAIPARLAIYPFSSVVIEGKVELARAADAENFKDANGGALFDERGIGTELLQATTLNVARSHLGVVQAMQLTDELDKAGVLKAAPLSLELSDGTSRSVDGYRFVDEAALAKLDVTARRQLEQSGAMALVTAQLKSMGNVARLASAPQFVVAKAPRKRSAPADAVAKRTTAKRTAAAPVAAIDSARKPGRAAKPKTKPDASGVADLTVAKPVRKPAMAKEKLAT